MTERVQLIANEVGKTFDRLGVGKYVIAFSEGESCVCSRKGSVSEVLGLIEYAKIQSSSFINATPIGEPNAGINN